MNNSKLNWQTDIDDWDQIPNNVLELILKLSEQELIETVETAKINQAKTKWTLMINISTISILVGYIHNEGFEKLFSDILVTSATFSICLLIIAWIYLAKNIREYSIGTIGDHPSFIFKKEMIFKDEFEGDDAYKNLMISTIERYQDKITRNTDNNLKKAKDNSKAILLMTCLPLSLLVGLAFYLVDSLIP